MNKHILHISGDFAKQSLYHDMAHALTAYDIDQSFFVPVRSQAELAYQGPGQDIGRYVAMNIIAPHHKVFFRAKINKITSALIEQFDVGAFSLCHAHFLYSDGAVALKLKQRFDLDYIVAVRNTDINFFMRYRPDLKNTMLRVAQNARKIVFLTPAYCEKFLVALPPLARTAIEEKTVIIPNALDEDWHAPVPRRQLSSDTLRVLYVGDFSRNKNIINLIKACAVMNKQQKLHLTLVGGGGNHEKQIVDYVDNRASDFVSYLGRVADRSLLMSIYREHDVLAMPSFRETFGLTYLEALSQGTPIVHSVGQGVDGLFPNTEIAQAVNPNDISSIARGILALANPTETRQSKCQAAVKSFTWSNIGRQIFDQYNEVLSN